MSECLGSHISLQYVSLSTAGVAYYYMFVYDYGPALEFTLESIIQQNDCVVPM